MSLPIIFRGLRLTIINEIYQSTYNDSREITAKLTENVIKQYKDANINKEGNRKIKKQNCYKKKLANLQQKLDETQKRCNEIAQEI